VDLNGKVRSEAPVGTANDMARSSGGVAVQTVVITTTKKAGEERRSDRGV